MGIFHWLTGKKKQPSITRIWLTKRAKYQGIANEIRLALADELQTSTIVVVAHFPDCLEELEALIATGKLENDRLHVSLADDLSKLTRRLRSDSERTVFLVGEKHPLKTHDEAILESALNYGENSTAVFHVSMEDAVMRLFAGEWVTNTLRQLGMKEDEVIEHPMVARQLEKARKKISEKAFGDSQADSAEKWIERNYPLY